MAGIATVTIRVDLEGLGSDFTISNSKVMTVPVEWQSGYTVLTAATTTALQLFDLVDHFDLDDIFGVYIKAAVGTVYITVDTAGTGTITSSTADSVLNVGEAEYFAVNPDGNLGLIVDGSAVTAAISWLVLAKVTA